MSKLPARDFFAETLLSKWGASKWVCLKPTIYQYSQISLSSLIHLCSTFPLDTSITHHIIPRHQASSQLVTQALRIRRSANVLELLQRWLIEGDGFLSRTIHGTIVLYIVYLPSWWQLKYFLFLPLLWERWSNLTSIFFNWVETTNELPIHEWLILMVFM